MVEMMSLTLSSHVVAGRLVGGRRGGEEREGGRESRKRKNGGKEGRREEGRGKREEGRGKR
jgi:hypothetical protein